MEEVVHGYPQWPHDQADDAHDAEDEYRGLDGGVLPLKPGFGFGAAFADFEFFHLCGAGGILRHARHASGVMQVRVVVFRR